MNTKRTIFALTMLAASCGSALADEIPGNCLASFKVKSEKVLVAIEWQLATNTKAAMSCATGELLRERLFVEGNFMLKQGDLSGTPAEAQGKALAAYDSLQKKVKDLPGEDTPGTLFSAGGYLFTKYQLATCILTAEEAGGTCWIAVVKFLAATGKFFQKVSQNESNNLKKQELLTDLNNLKPVIDALHGGPGDPNGARNRWVRTQTQLCRAIQQQCL
jgi:hypothetical protein